MKEFETTVRVLEKNERLIALGLSRALNEAYAIARDGRNFLYRNGQEVELDDGRIGIQYIGETAKGGLVLIAGTSRGEVVHYCGEEKCYDRIRNISFTDEGLPIFVGLRESKQHHLHYTVKGTTERESVNERIPYPAYDGGPIYVHEHGRMVVLVGEQSQLEVEAEYCFDISQQSDGRFLCVAHRRNQKSYVIPGKEESGPYGAVSDLSLAPDGKPAFVVPLGDSVQAVVHDGRMFELHDLVNKFCRISGLDVTADGRPIFRAEGIDGERIFCGESFGIVYEMVSKPRIDGNNIRYLAYDPYRRLILMIRRPLPIDARCGASS